MESVSRCTHCAAAIPSGNLQLHLVRGCPAVAGPGLPVRAHRRARVGCAPAGLPVSSAIRYGSTVFSARALATTGADGESTGWWELDTLSTGGLPLLTLSSGPGSAASRDRDDTTSPGLAALCLQAVNSAAAEARFWDLVTIWVDYGPGMCLAATDQSSGLASMVARLATRVEALAGAGGSEQRAPRADLIDPPRPMSFEPADIGERSWFWLAPGDAAPDAAPPSGRYRCPFCKGFPRHSLRRCEGCGR